MTEFQRWCCTIRGFIMMLIAGVIGLFGTAIVLMDLRLIGEGKIPPLINTSLKLGYGPTAAFWLDWMPLGFAVLFGAVAVMELRQAER